MKSMHLRWFGCLAALCALGSLALLAPLAAAADPLGAGDYNQDGVVGLADLQVWNSARFSFSPLADGDGDGVSDITDLMIWDDNRDVPATPPGSAPFVFYNPGTGGITLFPNGAKIYAFKLPALASPHTPLSSGLPGGVAWTVESFLGAFQGYDTSIVTSGTGTPAFTLEFTDGPVAIGQVPAGQTLAEFGPFTYDVIGAPRASVPVQLVPEPVGPALAFSAATALVSVARRRSARSP